MIFNSITELLYKFFMYLMSFLPETNPWIVALFADGLYNFKERLVPANWIFPVSEFYVMLNVAILLQLLIGFIKLTLFIGSFLTGGIIKK